MRYFFASFNWVRDDNSAHGFRSITLTTQGHYPSQKVLTEAVSNQQGHKDTCVLLNIVELSESDFNDFIQ